MNMQNPLNSDVFDLNYYDYNLPEQLIAQVPIEPRDASKLMVLDRKGNFVTDDITGNILNYLASETVIVLNDVKVIPGRFNVNKITGAKVEVLILSIQTKDKAKILLNSRRPIKSGEILIYNKDNISFEIEIQSMPLEGGVRIAEFRDFDLTQENIAKIGLPPLPPYIKREDHDKRFENDKLRYQTVFAENGQAAAAPTAGLHFTNEILAKLRTNYEVHKITLNVGLGTFQPVRNDDIRQHNMHDEYYSITPETVKALTNAKNNGKKILAVGTTVVRTLETLAQKNFDTEHLTGNTNIFIYPGYKYKFVDSIMTNFHLPKSTLIMMIAAFIGRDNILNAYKLAIEKGYRFFSYGDAMLII